MGFIIVNVVSCVKFVSSLLQFVCFVFCDRSQFGIACLVVGCCCFGFVWKFVEWFLVVYRLFGFA